MMSYNKSTKNVSVVCTSSTNAIIDYLAPRSQKRRASALYNWRTGEVKYTSAFKKQSQHR